MDWKTGTGAVCFAAWLGLSAPRPPRPNSLSLKARLAALPLDDLPVEQPVDIRWNRHAVPFIEAANDHDLAVAIGLVHAHLRLGQMETFRRIAAGRLSEMVGAAAVEMDRTLRLFDFGRAVPEMLARLPSESRAWLDGYVEGVNAVLMRAPLPHEFKLFALQREAWTVADVLTLGRLFAFDNAWLVWLRLLRVLDSPQWDALWNMLVTNAQAPDQVPIDDDEPYEAAAFAALEAVNNRSGSNALAVKRMGKTWIACDPHLGLSLPSNWLVAGYRSPAQCAVGLMIPGVPFIVTGRNPAVAWGGTSLHAHVSQLCDVSHLSGRDFERRSETIRVRWSRPRKVFTRACKTGPVLTDSRYYRRGKRRLALAWMGHRASDEITAMLRISKARDWMSFKAALEDFAVPGLNMIYADAAGHIGHALAAWIPRDAEADQFIASAAPWSELATTSSLPSWFDPKRGLLVSANERPESQIPIGTFFSSRERRERITALIENAPSIDLYRLAAIQQDVKSRTAHTLARLLAKAARLGDKPLAGTGAELVALLETWDGSYNEGSEAATLFETLLHRFAHLFYSPQRLTAYSASWALRDIICAEIEVLPLERIAPVVRKALSRCPKPRPWGDVHRLCLQHPLGQIPIAGRRYRFLDRPAAGSSDTVMKTASGLVAGKHDVRFGANARFIADLTSLDDNYFVLLGGQDGWLGSANFTDQVRLWRQGKYMRLPLRPEAVRREFTMVTRLTPRV